MSSRSRFTTILRNFVRLATALAISLDITALSNAAAPSGRDRLFEVDLKEFPRYRLIRLSKLGPTPFDCGRMMVEPAFAPEYSVSVYSRPSASGPRKYFVTYLTADRNLSQTTDAGGHANEAEAAKIRRVDCEISASAAHLTRQVWTQMLSGGQRPAPMQQEDAARSTDARIAEFSIQLPHDKILAGEFPVELPSGRKTRTLVELGDTLVDYCKAKSADRQTIAAKLERTATRLLETLKQEH